MDSEENDGLPLTEERSAALVRRFAHDVRNHLNGMEMEATFLDDVLTDSDACEALARLRNEATQVESLLQALVIRFVSPKREPVSATDLFNLWKSRAKRKAPNASVAWQCTANDAAINVDARMMADALGELILQGADHSLLASVDLNGAGVGFKVSWSGSDSRQAILPELERIVQRNGGHYQRPTDAESGERFVACVFPPFKD